jgi:hypothetical protein
MMRALRVALRAWWALLLALSCSPGARAADLTAPRPPVLAFYYSWYTSSTWCSCHMSDLPTIRYNSSDPAAVDRQLHQASDAGISGFIDSWWGAGDATDTNFALLLQRAAALQRTTGRHFRSSILLETDGAALGTPARIATALKYILTTYGNSPYYFHWQGKPVVFIWDALGSGRTLATWAALRRQVDPLNHSFWSVDGYDPTLLAAFDGLFLLSAADWGVLNGRLLPTVLGFRAGVDAYNAAHHTHRAWAAGVFPGHDDTRAPNHPHPYTIARKQGATYRESWDAALATKPDWITISSFNEWFEGTTIEPGVHYGNLYLTITKRYAVG